MVANLITFDPPNLHSGVVILSTLGQQEYRAISKPVNVNCKKTDGQYLPAFPPSISELDKEEAAQYALAKVLERQSTKRD